MGEHAPKVYEFGEYHLDADKGFLLRNVPPIQT